MANKKNRWVKSISETGHPVQYNIATGILKYRGLLLKRVYHGEEVLDCDGCALDGTDVCGVLSGDTRLCRSPANYIYKKVDPLYADLLEAEVLAKKRRQQMVKNKRIKYSRDNTADYVLDSWWHPDTELLEVRGDMWFRRYYHGPGTNIGCKECALTEVEASACYCSTPVAPGIYVPQCVKGDFIYKEVDPLYLDLITVKKQENTNDSEEDNNEER